MRKTREITIDGPAGSRDVGKTFLITEMSAMAADSWAIRALGAMMRSGVGIPAEIVQSGLQGFALYGIKALLAAPFEESAPLLAEVMDCVQIVEQLITRRLLDSDIEEIATITRLRDEVIEVHTGFSVAAVLLGAAAGGSMTEKTEPAETDSWTTQTSDTPSAP